MTEAAQLNRLLKGSPYSFEDNAAGNLRAREVPSPCNGSATPLGGFLLSYSPRSRTRCLGA